MSVPVSEPAGNDRARDERSEPQARFLRACRGLPVDHTPIWLMRQAGRYMAEYRALRQKHGMLELIQTPELAVEVTLQPIDAFGFDAAILFADILIPLIGMGLELEFLPGKGPHIDNPVRSGHQVDLLATPPAVETVPGTLEAIRLLAAELEPRGVPLIGFAGAPFTLASYAIEGGGSKDYGLTKAFLYSEPAAWDRLMKKLVAVQADYLAQQVAAGAQALQIFDSWVGLALGGGEYVRYVQPYNRDLLERLERLGVPVIHYSNGTLPYLDEVVACGGTVTSVDWRMPLGWAWDRIGRERPIQGNLDPIVLMAPWREVKPRVDAILDQAAGHPGHIFNAGHGLRPETSIDNVKRLVDYVRQRTAA